MVIHSTPVVNPNTSMVQHSTTACPMVFAGTHSTPNGHLSNLVSQFIVGWEWWVNRALDEPYNAYLTDPHTFGQKSADFLFGLT